MGPNDKANARLINIGRDGFDVIDACFGKQAKPSPPPLSPPPPPATKEATLNWHETSRIYPVRPEVTKEKFTKVNGGFALPRAKIPMDWSEPTKDRRGDIFVNEHCFEKGKKNPAKKENAMDCFDVAKRCGGVLIVEKSKKNHTRDA